MDTSNILQAQMTVEEVLQRQPEAWTVFRSKQTHCVGCFMQRFCSLQEVAQAYEIPLQDLVEELERCVNQSKNTKGVSHDNPL